MKKKIDLIKLIKKKFNHLKNIKILKHNDLLKDNILDSLELMSLLSYLEKISNFKIKSYLRKNKNLKVNNLENFC